MVYTWHSPPLLHSCVFKVLAGASKPSGFDDILALICVGCDLNRIRELHVTKASALHLATTGYKHFSMSKLKRDSGNTQVEIATQKTSECAVYYLLEGFQLLNVSGHSRHVWQTGFSTSSLIGTVQFHGSRGVPLCAES